MNKYRFLAVSFFTTALLSSCITSEKWIEDDVYSLKDAAIPINTDINEDTDYNAYLLQKQNASNKVVYANNPNQQPFTAHNQINWLQFGQPMNNFNRFNTFNSPFLGANGLVYYPMYGGSMYGNNIFFMNGCGYFGPNNNWGPTTVWATNNSSYTGNAAFTNTSLNGPRGSISGMGGINSRSRNALKSSVAPNTTTVASTRPTNKPVGTVPRPAKTNTPVTAGRSVTGNTAGRPAGGNVVRTVSRTVTTVKTAPRVGTSGGASVGRGTSGGSVGRSSGGGLISGGGKSVGRN